MKNYTINTINCQLLNYQVIVVILAMLSGSLWRFFSFSFYGVAGLLLYFMLTRFSLDKIPTIYEICPLFQMVLIWIPLI